MFLPESFYVSLITLQMMWNFGKRIYSGGWQSFDNFTIRFFRRKLPSLKETRSSNSVFATVLLVCRPAGYTAGTYASYVAILPTNLTIRHITCLCYGIPTIHKPRIETLDLCSSEHSKVCFEYLKTFRVTPENLASFCDLLPPKSEELVVGHYSWLIFFYSR